jgi:hypothetical protein
MEFMTTIWNHDSVNWKDVHLSLDKIHNTNTCVDKENEDDIARDVDDLSALFDELEDGEEFDLLDHLETNESDEMMDVEDLNAISEMKKQNTTTWIDDLEVDAANVDEISKAFEELAEQEMKSSQQREALDSSDDESSDEEDDNTSTTSLPSSKFIHASPTWATFSPLDPRSCIRTPVFSNLDARIPRVSIPRIDLAVTGAHVQPTPWLRMTDVQINDNLKQSNSTNKPTSYVHNAKTCWICKSSHSSYKKRALHRYVAKRSRRIWTKKPRYSGRSNVATSRVRDGGRFVAATRWI